MKRWLEAAAILLCVACAFGCANLGEAQVADLSVRPAASPAELTVTEIAPEIAPEEEVPADTVSDGRNEDFSGTPDPGQNPPTGEPDGMVSVAVTGGDKPLSEFGFAPSLILKNGEREAETIRPGCTWTKEGMSMVACGMSPLDLVDELEPLPWDPRVPEYALYFERTPDRVTVQYAPLTPDENGRLTADYEDLQAAEAGEDGSVKLPGGVPLILEIHAEWDEVGGFGGSGIYAARIGE